MNTSDTWLIVPVYNEAPVLAGVIGAALLCFPNIICVDDGSTDGSAEVVASTGAHLIRHPVNLGQGAALQTGVEYARARAGARFFVTFDADGQHQLSDAAAMVDRLRSEAVDLVVGTRFHGDESHIPILKRLVLKTVVKLSPRSRRLGLTDAHNGLRAFNRTVAEQLDITSNGMGHASEFIELVSQFGWRVVEHPVHIAYSEYSLAKGQSLLNGVNIVFEAALRRKR